MPSEMPDEGENDLEAMKTVQSEQERIYGVMDNDTLLLLQRVEELENSQFPPEDYDIIWRKKLIEAVRISKIIDNK